MGKADALSRRADHGDGSADNQNITLLTPEFFAVRALEGLEVVGEERQLFRDIRKETKSNDLEDVVLKAVKSLKSTRGRSIHSSEWAETDGLLYFRGKIYVPPGSDLRTKIVSLNHDSWIAGHPGRWKTLEMVSRNYWWPRMSKFIGLYTSTCDKCLRTKAIRRPPVGHLEPLPVPEFRWHTMSVDFIVELPDSGGYDAIMVVVDSLSKRAHFIPTTTTVTSEGSARLYLNNVWKLHGLPHRVVSDRGPQFVSKFTKEVYRLLGIELASSTSYHPQSDGQTERVNQELEQYLRLFTSERQDDWSDLLALAEFSYNNHIHSSTQQTPFMLDTGQHPQMGFEPHEQSSKWETANEFTERMKSTLEEARSALAKAKEEMARYYDQRRTPAPEFKPGDMVYLDASDISTTRPSKQLDNRRLGLYEVEKRVGRNDYRLILPPAFGRTHPTFHVVKLTPAPKDPILGWQQPPPPPPELVDGEPQWEVDEILDSRIVRRKLRYLIKWKGYGRDEDSWEPESDVNAPELVEKFHREHPEAPREIPEVPVRAKRKKRRVRVLSAPGATDLIGGNIGSNTSDTSDSELEQVATEGESSIA